MSLLSEEFNLLRWVMLARSKDQRLWLDHIKIEGNFVVATDGVRMHYAEFSDKFLSPLRELGDLLIPLTPIPKKFSATEKENLIYGITWKNSEGRFPDFRSVVPQSPEKCVDSIPIVNPLLFYESHGEKIWGKREVNPTYWKTNKVLVMRLDWSGIVGWCVIAARECEKTVEYSPFS